MDRSLAKLFTFSSSRVSPWEWAPRSLGMYPTKNPVSGHFSITAVYVLSSFLLSKNRLAEESNNGYKMYENERYVKDERRSRALKRTERRRMTTRGSDSIWREEEDFAVTGLEQRNSLARDLLPLILSFI
jgi:hypothetical protein